MRPVQIITDSTSDLTEELRKQHNIAVVPLYVNFGTQSYKDNVTITLEELFDKVKGTGKVPMTSAPTAADFSCEFSKYLDRGMDVLHISISSKVSASYQNACAAAAQFPEGRIKVIDSLNLSTGIGMLVLSAADHVQRGADLDEASRIIQSLLSKVRVEFIIDTVEYLHKGGRCSGLQMFFSSLLEIHPIISVSDGSMHMAAKIRGNRHLVLHKLVQNTLDNLDAIQPDRIFITNAVCEDEASTVKAQFTGLNKFKNILITSVGCVVGSHCGPRTIGIVYLEK
jgi:DegV family protein with EDD domain